MPQHRDPRYRGRRTTAPPKRKPGHLRTNYTDNDPMYYFYEDLKVVRAVWPEEVQEADRKAARKYNYRLAAICTAIPMAIVTAFAVGMVWDHQILWWVVPVAQSVFLLYFVLLLFLRRRSDYDEDISIYLYREADRRGIKYQKGVTPLYAIMNRINADYNSHLWNRNFKWK